MIDIEKLVKTLSYNDLQKLQQYILSELQERGNHYEVYRTADRRAIFYNKGGQNE